VKRSAHRWLILASLAAATLALSVAPAAHAGDGKAQTAKGAEAGGQRLQDNSGQRELEFKGLDFETDRFIVEEFYEMIKMQRLNGNVSGGMTEDGLKLRLNW